MHFTIFLSAFVRVMCKLHMSSHCSRKHGAGPTVNRAVSSVASIENPRAGHPGNPFWTVGFPGGSDGKKICLQCRRPGFNPWVKKIPWRREWLLTPVFLSGEFHGQRSLAGYSPWGCKELDTTEPTFWKYGPSSFLTWLPYGQTQLSDWTELNWLSENGVSVVLILLN